MSPAGLKGVAEEAGLEMVIVCGQNMGDIFRRNSFNLGLHVVQSPEAVTDAQDGDVVQLRSGHPPSDERTRKRTYDPVPLSAKGRGDPEERRHFCGRPPRIQGVGGGAAGDRLGRTSGLRAGMTTTEQIVWAHRVDKDLRPRRSEAGNDASRVRGPAACLRRHGAVCDPHLQPDHRRQHDLSAAGRDCQRSLRVHGRRSGRQADRNRPRSLPSCTASRSRTTQRPATASFISISRNRDW